MKLTTFITSNLEEILLEWEVYATTLFPVAPVQTPDDLRDHAKQLLQAVVKDLQQTQSAAQQEEKSKGEPAEEDVDRKSASAVHGDLRHASGFTMLQLTAEFRALRASVLRLWKPHIGPMTEEVLDELMRFNEAIDQALTQSVVTFTENTERTRDTFLAILGHDLRSPLATMAMAGDYFTRLPNATESAHQMGVRIARSAACMAAMVKDLLAYSRTQLGGKIPLDLRRENVHLICQVALDDAQAGHPNCPFVLEGPPDLMGWFDPPRLQQVFTNLLNNASQYCAPSSEPVVIRAWGDAETITVQVRNRGPVIPASSLTAIFDPMVQLAQADHEQEGAPPSSLGLGLFIVRGITHAHGGSVTATSDEAMGTVFTVTLPRTMPAKKDAK